MKHYYVIKMEEKEKMLTLNETSGFEFSGN